MNIRQLISEKRGTVVDVRTPEEFNDGAAPGSINIPLQEIDNHIDELKAMPKPLILCCASGGRSGMATHKLSQIGIECVNAGSWFNVNNFQQQPS